MDNRNEASSQLGTEPCQSPVHSKGLAVAEYTSLGFSVAGTIAAFLSKQAAYAAAPISVSLFLNLLNRQRLNQQIEQQSQLSVQQSQQLEQFGQRFEPVQLQVGELQAEVNAQAQIQQDLPEFAAKLVGQLDQAQEATAGQIRELQASLSGLASTTQLEQLQAEFSDQLTPLAERWAEQKQATEGQIQGLQALAEQLSVGRARLDGLESRLVGLEQIEDARPDFAFQIDRLHRAMAGRLQAIQTLFSDLASREDKEQLESELAQQTQRIHSLSAQLSQLQTELNSYVQKHGDGHQALSATNQVDELTRRLSWLEEKLTTSGPESNPGLAVATLQPSVEQLSTGGQVESLSLNLASSREAPRCNL